MTHLVQQIVAAVKTTLTGLTTTTTHVYDGMPRVLEAASLPCLVIEETSDQAEMTTRLYPRVLFHTLSLTVRAYVKMAAPPATLRQIRLEVEKAMAAAAPSIGGVTKDVRFAGADRRELDTDTDTPVAALFLNYLIDYSHLETTPDVAF